MALVDVLIPTYRRKTGLAVVLASLLGQTFRDFDVIVADQTPDDASYLESVEIATLVRALRWHGHGVALHRRSQRRGMAEQRQFLLERSRAPYVHYLDDDVLLDPLVMQRMLGVLRAEGCGFVGCAATGLEYLVDVRPHEQRIEVWDGPVMPEPFAPGAVPMERHKVNNAANALHLERRLCEGDVGETAVVRYKVAWVGGANVLYDRRKLESVGAFSFWPRLPAEHAGEEVVVQFLLIRAYGGCGILPSGTYHLGLPTNVADRRANATALFGELLREHADVIERASGTSPPTPSPTGGGAAGQGDATMGQDYSPRPLGHRDALRRTTPPRVGEGQGWGQPPADSRKERDG